MDNIFSFLFRFPSADGHHEMPLDDREDSHHDDSFFGFRGFPFNHDDMFHQFDEAFNRMMKNFGTFDGHSLDQEQGDFYTVPSLPAPPEGNVPLRDKMLKRPDTGDRLSPGRDGFFDQFPHFSNSERTEEARKDNDLDDTVRSGGLGKIFENPSQEVTPEAPKTSRFFRSVSVRTHRNADGRVEERRTMVDDAGQHTTVTRSVDGQTVRQTTIQKKNGEQETIEDLINMDEKEKDNFEERWHSPRARSPQQLLPRSDDALHNPGDTSIFHRLFGGLLFPGARKD